MKNYENFARFRRDPNSKLHFPSFCPNWPLGPVKIPVLEAFFTAGIFMSSTKMALFGRLTLRKIRPCQRQHHCSTVNKTVPSLRLKRGAVFQAAVKDRGRVS